MKNMTIKDIARLAGVSAMTVSNVIHHKTDKVSTVTFEKVKKIIDDHNFTLSQNASSLKSKASNLIGLLYYTKFSKVAFSNPFVASVLSGIEDIAKDMGFFVMVHAISDANDVTLLQRNWNFAGFIMVGLYGGNFDQFAKRIEIPVVYVDTLIEEGQRNFEMQTFVQVDEVGATDRAMQYLKEKGHQKIAFLSYRFDKRNTGVIQSRFSAYQTHVIKDILFCVDDESEVKLVSLPEFVTAVLATSDILALEIWRQYPDVSVVGFDDIFALKYLSPSLTTTRIDQTSKGKMAMVALSDLIETRQGQICEIESELIIRESVTPI